MATDQSTQDPKNSFSPSKEKDLWLKTLKYKGLVLFRQRTPVGDIGECETGVGDKNYLKSSYKHMKLLNDKGIYKWQEWLTQIICRLNKALKTILCKKNL